MTMPVAAMTMTTMELIYTLSDRLAVQSTGFHSSCNIILNLNLSCFNLISVSHVYFAQVETLTETIHQKDFLLEKLTYQCQHLETILGYQSSLRDLLETMESSSISVDSARITRPLSENSTSLKNGDIENSSPFPSSSSSSSHKAVLEYSVTEFSDNESPVNERKKMSFTTKDKEYYL